MPLDYYNIGWKKEMENLSLRLVDKSIEAFIMGLEIYNKPTINYRIEGFSFFICNAWELMLKAELLNRNESIYYKDNPDRTITLENCIRLIYTNENGSLRKNLERIVHLRNISTHFITEEYERIYAPLFQANIMHFVNGIKDFHNKEITDYISQNFLTLSIRLNDTSEEEIKAKYSVEMAEKLLNEVNQVTGLIEESNSEFAIAIENKFYITKNKKEADFSVNIDNNASTTVQKFREIKDPNHLYPHTTKDIIKLVNRKLKIDDILVTVIQNNIERKRIFNSSDFQLFIKFYDIKSNEKYCYHFKIGNRYIYSQAVVDFITTEIKSRPRTIIQELKKGLKK